MITAGRGKGRGDVLMPRPSLIKNNDLDHVSVAEHLAILVRVVVIS
ncbi:hypothetical protein [Actinomadura pelletieri]|nr:hypothetical protein [Actinomadura pelletieri]